jgi:chromosome segregation ATPase
VRTLAGRPTSCSHPAEPHAGRLFFTEAKLKEVEAERRAAEDGAGAAETEVAGLRATLEAESGALQAKNTELAECRAVTEKHQVAADTAEGELGGLQTKCAALQEEAQELKSRQQEVVSKMATQLN